MSTIETLAMAIDAKDQITHGHIRRVQTYAVGLAQRIGIADQNQIKAIEAAALLHDMGKLAVPEYILNKPGPLTPAEFEKMKLHASVGADILSAINFPYPVVPIVRHHHENWDGTGYPDGLVGADIPIGARILSVVDCFDALTSDRPYRPKLPDEEAIAILLKRKGNMYDPLVVDTFLEVHQQIAPEPLPELDTTPLRAIIDASLNTSPLLTLPQRPLDEIAASTEEMLTLFHLARGLHAQMTLQDVGDVIVKHLRRLVPCSLAVFFIYRIDTDELVAAHAIGEGAPLVTGIRIDRGERLSGWVAANRKTIRNSDPILDLGDLVRSIAPRLMSCLSAPLVSQDSLVGVLSLYSPMRNAFNDEHQRVVEVVARQVSKLIRQASEFDRAKQVSQRDKATGLPNIDNLKQLSAQDPSRDELDEPTSVVIVELAHVSGGVIDSQTMSAALTLVAQAIRKTLRAADLLFRHREGEFIILLLHTPIDTTQAIVRRLRETLIVECRDTLPSGLKWVIAMATAPEEGSSIAALIEGASQKLSQQSQHGQLGPTGSESVH
jgi:putative nucleotidyltransferase with HDIG domain